MGLQEFPFEFHGAGIEALQDEGMAVLCVGVGDSVSGQIFINLP